LPAKQDSQPVSQPTSQPQGIGTLKVLDDTVIRDNTVFLGNKPFTFVLFIAFSYNINKTWFERRCFL
jgi:hypothetical protein